MAVYTYLVQRVYCLGEGLGLFVVLFASVRLKLTLREFCCFSMKAITSTPFPKRIGVCIMLL